ncbi:MAG: UDP-glucose 4-epimerase GalE [Pseudomonadales bacterium]
MRVLLTGGAGYIGSHTAVELLNAGHDVVIVDNLSNSSYKAVQRVERLTNKTVSFHEKDLLEAGVLDPIFKGNSFDTIIHFAGLKAVGESVQQPLSYYRTNILSTLNLCESMLLADINNLVFSSSATVYGEPESMPLDENSPVVDATNPYGRTKLMIEKILEDFSHANAKLNIAILRYFNPGGSHESGEIGEDPNGIPNNLLPFVTQVAMGKMKELVVFGNDYPTHDGTCIRDYIHVVDLARGHLAAIEKLKDKPGLVTYNLGTGTGYSVMDIIKAFEKANDLTLPHRFGPRRPGDVAESYTNPNLALSELNWKAEKTIEDICRDAWKWQQRNPNGYGE